MKRPIFISFFLMILLAGCSREHPIRVIDGDTIEVAREVVRILNIDTPEIGSAKCSSERERGLKAKNRLAEILANAEITLKRGDGKRMQDRYGRTLSLVFVDGRDVGELLIAEGHARRWSGKRRPWC